MGFAKNWLEEIVAEWLSLEGYSVETNVPLKSKLGDGRNEADVLGFMFKGEYLQIVHAEATVQLTQSHDDNVEKIKKKFSKENVEAVLEIAKTKYGEREIGSTRHIFVCALASSRKEAQNLKETLISSNIEFIEFPELVHSCLTTISKEGEKRVDKGLNKTSEYSQAIFAALPDGLWFMKMLGMMQRHGMLNISESVD
ncbi:hypothetical protein ACNF40_04555 [Cuniculiplasma sp. SKW4]|uniref:hypothetical protein n=1 Tax=Cuniculiplasma sp. SKW4 TaxID=3400171 RepID=UPI003FD477C3